MMTMTVTEMYQSVTLVRHYIQNMTVDIIKKKCHRNNNLAVIVNDTAPCPTALQRTTPSSKWPWVIYEQPLPYQPCFS